MNCAHGRPGGESCRRCAVSFNATTLSAVAIPGDREFPATAETNADEVRRLRVEVEMLRAALIIAQDSLHFVVARARLGIDRIGRGRAAPGPSSEGGGR